MKPFKHLACLVTLSLLGALPLRAEPPHAFRQWTDPSGRTTIARVVEKIDSDRVKIEREDGQRFTVSLKALSATDQAYVKSLPKPANANQPAKPVMAAGLKEADAALWELLATAGAQPENTYSGTGLNLVLESINQRLVVREIQSAAGKPLHVRTEPAALAARIKLSGAMPRMSLNGFIQELARANHLVVATDKAGMVVLFEKSPTAENAAPPKFLGVEMSSN